MKIVSKLEEEAQRKNFITLHIILNDGSTFDRQYYQQIKDEYGESPKRTNRAYNVKFLDFVGNRGREGFWSILNTLFEQVKAYARAKWFVATADDAIPCRDFLTRITEHFKRLRAEDPECVAMNICPSVLMNWNTPRFLDGAYIADIRLFEALRFKMARPTGYWRDNPASGSGMGYQMTIRLLRHPRFNIAPCQDVAYLEPLEVESVMFPRKLVPGRPLKWWRDNFVDRIRVTECQSEIARSVPRRKSGKNRS